MIMTIDQALQVSYDVGFRDDDLVTIVSIGLAESHLNTEARGHNLPDNNCPNGSIDRGWLQINDCYHADISDACAYDASCAAESAHTIVYHGGGFSEWSTYVSGIYQQFVSLVKDTAERIGLYHQSSVPIGDMVMIEVPASWVSEVSAKLGIADPTITASSPPPSTTRTYTVQEGDTLSGIAEKIAGDAGLWPSLYALNAQVIGPDPNVIHPDMVLEIPSNWPTV